MNLKKLWGSFFGSIIIIVLFSHCSYSFMLTCWNEAPDKRPPFSTIVQLLEEMITPLAGYLDVNFLDSFQKSDQEPLYY